MEEVFDQATLLTLRELMSKGELSELNGVVSAGKEARFYYGAAGKGFPASLPRLRDYHPAQWWKAFRLGDLRTGSEYVFESLPPHYALDLSQSFE